MKKTLSIVVSALLFFVGNVSAQQSASGKTTFASTVCCFNGFTWTINYSFVYNANNAKGIELEINNTSISVANNKWQTKGQQFSPSDLGFSRWPVESVNETLSGTITIYYKSSPVKTFNQLITNSTSLGRFDQYKDGGKDGPYAGIGSVKIKLSDFNVSDLSVKFTNVSNGGVNPGGDQIYKAYQAKQRQGTAEAGKSQSGEVLINAQQNTNSSPATDPPKHELKLSDIGIPDDNAPTTSGNSNPMTKYSPTTSTGSSAVDNFNKGLDQGQQIVEIATGIVDLFAPTPAQLQRREEQNLKIKNDKNDEQERIYQFWKSIKKKNEVLNSWSGFQKYFIQQIPNLLENSAPTWSQLLGSSAYENVFGKDIKYITENFKSNSGKKALEKATEKGLMYLLPTPPIFADFYAAISNYGINYNLANYKNNLPMMQNHRCTFIFDEKNIVIGIQISIDTWEPAFQSSTDIYLKDIISKIGGNYILVAGNTFLLKDKLVIVEYNNVIMYDLNTLSDKIYLRFPIEYANIEKFSNGQYKFKAIGVRFERDEDKSIYLTKQLGKAKITSLVGEKKVFYKTQLSDKGIIVEEVVPGLPAEKAGLKSGDIISEIKGIRVTTPYMFQLIIQGHVREEKLELTYLREDKEFKAVLNL